MLTDTLAASGGEELQWLGDGQMAAFASPADAVRCAVAMQQGAVRPIDGERLRVRVGLNVGEIMRGTGGGYFGTPVVTARRLCDGAHAGQILCASTVAGLLAGRRAFRFRDLGPQALKGLTDPVGVAEVEYEAEEPTAFLATTPFVGRDEEMGRIVGLLHRACAGEGALVMVVGEPGIGKTRTAEELAELARRDGARVLPGRCYEGEWAPPYGPFVEAIEAYARVVTPEELRADLGFGAPPLTRLVPSLREAVSRHRGAGAAAGRRGAFPAARRRLPAPDRGVGARPRPPRPRRPPLGRPGHDRDAASRRTGRGAAPDARPRSLS